MSMRTRNILRNGRRYGRSSSRRYETLHSSERLDVLDDELASQVLPGQAFNEVELSPAELSPTSSTVADDDTFNQESSGSPMDEFDPDPTGVGAGDQTYSDLSSSSSEDIVLGSSALAARDSIALLHEFCDKLIGSMQNTSSHINEANTEYLTIQGDTNYGYDPDPTGHMKTRDPTHLMNALNIQQLVLANIMKTELIHLEAVTGGHVIR